MPESTVVKIEYEPEYIITTDDGGRKARSKIAPVIRAEDVPTGLTYLQVGAITTLANLIVVLIRTLIDKQVLDESFLEDDDLDLDALIQVIEEMGGAYHDPDLTVS